MVERRKKYINLSQSYVSAAFLETQPPLMMVNDY